MCNWTQRSFVDSFISKHLFFAFSETGYNSFCGFIAEYFNVSFTFYWSFLDIFIMVISIGISFQYEKINYKIGLFRDRSMPDLVWSKVRMCYNEVSTLLKLINASMNKMVILACCNDAYFVIIQLLNVTS